MTNDVKRPLLTLSRKLISDLTSELNTEVASIQLYSKKEVLDNCYEILDKIRARLDQLKSELPS